MNPSSDPSPDRALAAFLERVGPYVPRTPQLVPVSHPPAQAKIGEIWLTQAATNSGSSEEPLTVVLLERFAGKPGKATLFTAAPIFSDPHMAGPSDIVLPREILAFEAGIAFESAGSILSENLRECEGALPENWASKIAAFRDYVLGRAENPPEGVTIGAPFVDENDPAFIFHEELAERMQPLAELALAWGEGTALVTVPEWAISLFGKAKQLGHSLSADLSEHWEELTEWWEERARPILIPSPAYGMAADHLDAGRPRFGAAFRVADSDARIGLVECVSPAATFALTVFADPNHSIEGAEVLDGAGQVVTKISDGKAASTFPLADGLFLLRLSDGTLAALHHEHVE